MILHGDALTMLKTLSDESVHCCVTSPPYWGLRAYGTNPQIWGGDKDCQHEWQITLPRRERHPEDVKDVNSKQTTNVGANCELSKQNICLKCNAWRGELGLEPTPELYVQHLVAVFREVRRVLKKEGTLWLNLGDSYGTGTTAPRKQGSRGLGDNTQQAQDAVARCGGMAKQLLGIPWRVAFALQSDGWYLRQDIIWHKPNPMPESVTDRCTKAHEYIFLLSKNGRYYYDAEAIKEPLQDSSISRLLQNIEDQEGSYRVSGKTNGTMKAVRPREKGNGESAVDTKMRGYGSHCGTYFGGRNRRSVWTIATHPYKEAHFATFPPDLIKPCILAGCPEGGIVLDPFFGSGTTGLVCSRLNRQYIGIELNEQYVEMSKRRIEGDAPLLNQNKENIS